jgi:hypothetical protein
LFCFPGSSHPGIKDSLSLIMALILQALLLLVLSLLYPILAVDSITDQIALGSAPGFNSLSTCGWCCLCAGTGTGNCTTGQCVADAIQCDSNSCFCRTDKLQDALAYVATCVRNSCSDEGESAAYQNVLSGYCVQFSAITSSLSISVPLSTITTSGIYFLSPASHFSSSPIYAA